MFERRSFSRPFLLAAALAAASAGAAVAGSPPGEREISIGDLPDLGEQPADASPVVAVSSRLGLDTPVFRLCADPPAKAVLDSDQPGLTSRPEYVFFKHMSLNRLKAMSRGRMTDADLAKVDAELQRISLDAGEAGDR